MVELIRTPEEKLQMRFRAIDKCLTQVGLEIERAVQEVGEAPQPATVAIQLRHAELSWWVGELQGALQAQVKARAQAE